MLERLSGLKVCIKAVNEIVPSTCLFQFTVCPSVNRSSRTRSLDPFMYKKSFERMNTACTVKDGFPWAIFFQFYNVFCLVMIADWWKKYSFTPSWMGGEITVQNVWQIAITCRGLHMYASNPCHIAWESLVHMVGHPSSKSYYSLPA